jgi:hypothetical protein
MAERLFTLDEANALIPRLEMEFLGIARSRKAADEAARALGGEEAAGRVLRGEAAPEGREQAGAALVSSVEALAAGVQRVNALGCTVKDLDLGLVDFSSEQGGTVVSLCWQFGEPEVAHYHGLDEGFAARKRLSVVEQEALRH